MDEGVNLFKRRVIISSKVEDCNDIKYRWDKKGVGQEEPVFIALANISEVLKGAEISPEIVTIFMNEY